MAFLISISPTDFDIDLLNKKNSHRKFWLYKIYFSGKTKIK